MRILIADSDARRAEWLGERLALLEGAELLGTCDTSAAAEITLREEEPDLLLVEATLPGAGGLALLRDLDEAERPISVVVATDASWTLATFEVGASGYLLWPTDEAGLEHCLRRARQEVAWRLAAAAAGQRSAGRHVRNRMVLRVGDRFVFRPIAELEVAEAERNYVKLVFGSESNRVRMPLGEIERRLDPESFIRIHRSIIVNRSHITAVEIRETGELNVILRNRRRLPTGRSYRASVRGLLACTA
jgi:DNA-binding LytR/AlgR family response regulator